MLPAVCLRVACCVGVHGHLSEVSQWVAFQKQSHLLVQSPLSPEHQAQAVCLLDDHTLSLPLEEPPHPPIVRQLLDAKCYWERALFYAAPWQWSAPSRPN